MERFELIEKIDDLENTCDIREWLHEAVVEASYHMHVRGSYRRATYYEPADCPDYDVDYKIYTNMMVHEILDELDGITKKEVLEVLPYVAWIKDESDFADRVVQEYIERGE